MFTHDLTRTARRLLLSLIVAAILAVPIARPAPADAAKNPAATKVYVLRGGDVAADSAVVAALRAGGYKVDAGVEAIGFDGSQANLRKYDAVVLLYGSAWQTPLPAGGVAAITAYLRGGGALIASEWAVASPQLGALMPATSCGYSSRPSTVYRQASADPRIASGMPVSFTLALPSIAGSEACLRPRPEATLLFRSDNGDPELRAGLLAWSAGGGRVAAFSTLLGASELQSLDLQRLLQNTVAYLQDSRDLTPPKVRRARLTGEGGLTAQRQLTLDVAASDSGGSGVGTIYVAEYIFSGDPEAPWQVVRRSGWLPYRAPGLSIAWEIGPTPGVHYLQVFAADRAGNQSVAPALAFVSYQPAQASVARDELRIYQIRPPAGAEVTVRLDALQGNPDLSISGQGVSYAPGSDGPREELTFTAQGGVYQIAVEGYQASSYALQVGAAPGAAAPPLADGPRLDRPRGSIIFLARSEPGPDQAGQPPPPVSDAPGGEDSLVYLPLIIRGE